MQSEIEFKVYRRSDNADSVSEIIRDLISEMPNHGVEHYFQTKGRMLVESSTVVVAHDSTGYVGIMVLSKEDVNACKSGIYIRTLLVSERYHRHNLAYQLICYGFNTFYTDYKYFPDFILMTTYNPVTYRMMKGFTKSNDAEVFMYPLLDGEPEFYQKMIATKYALHLCPDCEFNGSRGGIINGGGEIPASFWRDYPASRDGSIMDYFKQNVGDRDRLLCIIFCESNEEKKIIFENLKIKDSDDAIRKYTPV